MTSESKCMTKIISPYYNIYMALAGHLCVRAHIAFIIECYTFVLRRTCVNFDINNVEHFIVSYLTFGFRFALACNSSEKIIEPIQSRCAMLRYSKLSDAQVAAS